MLSTHSLQGIRCTVGLFWGTQGIVDGWHSSF